MYKIIETFFIFLFFQNIVYSQNLRKDYIQFFVDGTYDKPYYSFVFSHNNSDSGDIKENFYHRRINVEHKKFDSISTLIERCEYTGAQHILDGSYHFVIINNGEERIFSTVYVEPIIKIFQIVYLYLKYTPEAELLKSRFNLTLLRLARIDPIK